MVIAKWAIVVVCKGPWADPAARKKMITKNTCPTQTQAKKTPSYTEWAITKDNTRTIRPGPHSSVATPGRVVAMWALSAVRTTIAKWWRWSKYTHYWPIAE